MQPMSEFLKSMQESIGLIAQQAGVLVDHLWIVLTKQQFLYGLQEGVKGVIAIIFSVFVARWMVGIQKTRMALWDKKTLLVLGFIVMLISVFWGASILVDSLPHLFNPEYYSIREAVDLLSKVRK